MSDTELRKLRAILEPINVDEKHQWYPRCSQDKDGILYCAAKEFRKGGVVEAAFAAAKDEEGNIQYLETLGDMNVIKRIHRDLGKGALR